MNNSISRYIDSFQTVYEGEPWYGRSIISILKAIPPSRAYRKSTGEQHSIYEIVEHLLVWRELFVKRLNGDHSSSIKMNSPSDWPGLPTAQTAANWDTLLTRLDENQNRLINSLKELEDEMLNKEFAQTKVTLDEHLEGHLQHDIYHLGQISLLNKLYVE
jgi:uncharacterized damage-inducible protein DinB